MSADCVVPGLRDVPALFPADERCTAGLLLAWGLWGLVVTVRVGAVVLPG